LTARGGTEASRGDGCICNVSDSGGRAGDGCGSGIRANRERNHGGRACETGEDRAVFGLDWTWLNGNPRNKDTAFDSKFFTPEIRADITYNYDFISRSTTRSAGRAKYFAPTKFSWSSLALAAIFTTTTSALDS